MVAMDDDRLGKLLEVARYPIEKGLTHVDGVVYLGDNDVRMIYERKMGRPIQMDELTIPLSSRFAFYDQVHTTGTDIPHVESAVAVCTLGMDITFRDCAQGMYRFASSLNFRDSKPCGRLGYGSLRRASGLM